MSLSLMRAAPALAALCLVLSGCAASSAPNEPTSTPPLPTARPTVTPRPTPTRMAATLPPPAQPVATPTPVVHIVQPNETLLGIANRYGVSLADLLAANAGVEPTRLQIGQRIVIPPPGAGRVRTGDAALLPSPTPLPYEIRGLNSTRTPAGSLDILGEVFNPGPSAMNNVKVLVSLQDAAGNPLQNAIVSTMLAVIPPNQASPFRVLFTDPPPNYAQFTVRPMRGEAAEAARSVVPLRVVRVEGRPEGARFRVNGELTNASNETPSAVNLLVTVYDAERRVVGYRYIALSSAPLPPGASLPFDASLTALTSQIASFAVYAEGVR
ncbi:MAG: FxLYD domain-containing protein [Thermoflexales bacterium]|nr:FxLYD domain-containing protein [Thermoflexales bacterium]